MKINFVNEILFYTSIFFGCRTERVINIVWELTDPELEGYETNSVFRVKDYWLERILSEPASCAIEISVAQASPLTCPLDKINYEHGCYSAD